MVDNCYRTTHWIKTLGLTLTVSFMCVVYCLQNAHGRHHPSHDQKISGGKFSTLRCVSFICKFIFVCWIVLSCIGWSIRKYEHWNLSAKTYMHVEVSKR